MTVPGWEDSAVPPEKVGDYLKDLRELFKKYGYNPSLYGHFGQGCIHCRVEFDLFTKEGIGNYKQFTIEASHLASKLWWLTFRRTWRWTGTRRFIGDYVWKRIGAGVSKNLKLFGIRNGK